MKNKSYLIALLLVGFVSGCSTTATQKQYIKADIAKEIAVREAGLALDQIISFEVDLNDKGDLKYYDVDFVAEDRSYEYDIDAYTGEILGYGQGGEKRPAVSDKPVVSDTTLTADQAKQLALSKVPGATLDDIREFEIDRDDGRFEYEGKIYYEKMEYEFEIDAASGAFRSWDVESIYD